MKLIDSSVMVAFLNKSDELHEKAVALDLEGAVMTQLVFAEVSNVLQKRVGDKNAVCGILKRVLDSTPILPVSVEDMHSALAVFSAHYPKLSFTDSALAVQSRKFGAELLTFDEDLRRAIA